MQTDTVSGFPAFKKFPQTYTKTYSLPLFFGNAIYL
jgi:hypothetical protein